MKKSRVTMLAAVAAVSLATLAAVAQLGAANPQARLAEDVRRATAAYHDAALAEKAGYGAFLGCVNGPQEGAMGVHYVNGDYVNDDVLDPQKPEALMYELKDGKLRLLGVEYIIFAEKWHAKNPKSAPTLGGQVMHYTGSPNRYGIPAFYALHVWAWRTNPRRRVRGLEQQGVVRRLHGNRREVLRRAATSRPPRASWRGPSHRCARAAAAWLPAGPPRQCDRTGPSPRCAGGWSR